MEEIKEVELRSRRGKFIHNRTYSPVGLNKVSHFSRRGRARSRLPMKKLKSLLKKTRKARLFVWKGILKIHHCHLKFIATLLKNRNCLYLHRYRSNKSVRFLLGANPKLVRKQGKVYLLSKHKRRGYLGGVRYENRGLSKYLSLCTCNFPFYGAYESSIHRVNFGFLLISRRIQDLNFMLMLRKRFMLHTVKETL